MISDYHKNTSQGNPNFRNLPLDFFYKKHAKELSFEDVQI